MSDVIRLLPDSVANQIAAGEVIQRPSAVIKELVENAIDAGATEVRIFIRDAGRTLIQVIDNGRGMTETDARMAFERHATSKISSADDLFTLCTMGFRGEALPSICAISQVELRTRTAEDKIGTRLLISGSKTELQEPCVCDTGTNIMVKNLFFNVPARRKFLRSDSVELTNIMREFERMALVNNRVRLSIDTGGKTLDLMPANLKQRISDIWKNNLKLQLLPLDLDTSLIKITGFISRPEFARKRNPLQFLIVNGRNMRHPVFHKAILSCYDNLIAPETQPCYFLKFEVDPATIDVNISPTKNEIKFENEREIWPILTAAVRAALGKFSAVPSIDFEADTLPVDPLPLGTEAPAPAIELPKDYNPFDLSTGESGRKSRPIGQAWRPTRTDRDWEQLYTDFMSSPAVPTEETGRPAEFPDGIDFFHAPEEEAVTVPHDEALDMNPTPASICVQFADSYIVTPTREGLVVIDQHRAHVRILFEEYISRITLQQEASQRVMFPETLRLDPSLQLAYEEVEDELRRLGFVLVAEGEEGVWRIEGVPPSLGKNSPTDVILRILDSVTDDSVTYGAEADPAESIRRKVALVLARSAAINRGTRLSSEEMEHLVVRLFSLPDPTLSPGGSRVLHILPEATIEALFR